jgi:adenylate kinase family enzyme
LVSSFYLKKIKAGAPGAGKGTVTRFILEHRGLTSQPIITSDLLVFFHLKNKE